MHQFYKCFHILCSKRKGNLWFRVDYIYLIKSVYYYKLSVILYILCISRFDKIKVTFKIFLQIIYNISVETLIKISEIHQNNLHLI